jgi:polysaccharide biosynthesis protein PslG
MNGEEALGTRAIRRNDEETLLLMFDACDTATPSSRTRRRGGAAAALLCLALLLTAVALTRPAEAKRVPKGFFGIAPGVAHLDSKDYEKMRKTRITTCRVWVFWKAVEPQRGVYRWDGVDAQVGALAESGITPVVMIWGAPQWATGSVNPGVPPLKGTAEQAWKSFLKTAVERYKKGGTYWKENPDPQAKPVESWQIWNEPNLPKYFAKDETDPPKSAPKTAKSYAKLVKSSDEAIGRADEHGQVILAGLSSAVKKKKLAPNTFIKKFLKTKRITKRFDAAALHPYAPKISKYESRVSKFRKAMNKNGAQNKPIWLTEVGWGSKHGHGSLNKGKSGQAKLLKKSFQLTLEKRHKWGIDRLLWFDWRDPPKGGPVGCSFCPSAGLLKSNQKPKPAYRQFKQFAKMQGKDGGGHRQRRQR